MGESKKIISIRVSPELHKVIKRVALENDVTIQDYIVGLIMGDIQVGKNESVDEILEKIKGDK